MEEERKMSRFDEVIERKDTDSEKYDFPERFGGDAQAIPMWVADMDFRAPDAVVEAVRKKAEYGIWGYSEAREGYYENVISWFKKRHNWEPQREWIVKTPGVIFALSAAVKALTEPGDAVLIQQPVYHPFVNCIVHTGRRLVNNELVLNSGRYEMNLEEMEELIRREKVKLFLLCNPHNPVGRVWTREELKRVDDLCARYGVFVVSDEIHADFVYPGHKYISYASLSEETAGRCMVCTAPSKTFNLAGLQVSNIFVPDEARRKAFEKELYLTGYEELNVFALTACQAAYEAGGPWLDELLVYLEGNLDMIRSFLSGHLPEIEVIRPEGTYLLWLDFTRFAGARGWKEEELMDFLLHRAHVWLSPGSGFGASKGLFMRLNMACPRSTIQRALKQLLEAAEKETTGKG